MPSYKDERELVRKWIKPALKQQGFLVRNFVGYDKLHSKLKAEENLSKEELAMNFPAQPEIDVVFWPEKHFTPEPVVYAAEVKYFRSKGGSMYPEIYSGVGEAIAYLGFGFDGVFLWHLFDSELNYDLISKVKSYVSSLILNSQASITYRSITVPRTQQNPTNPPDITATIEKIFGPQQIQSFFATIILKTNQMRNQPEVDVRRTIIRKALRIV